ncbi:BON domain-containing protein [Chthonobacter rhizosphaerae]|uniref:BON domain-containing protein n=1 Tax=Chthonobacter rhizosphaerae TaxID=2735553 RepID=UPI0015EF7B94|nr:BON domain-containing protein [Chthonobacter rhizosphaerae]
MAGWKVQAASVTAVAAVLTVAAVAIKGGDIEESIRERAGAALAPEVTSWAGLEVNGRDVTLTGAAPTPSARELAENRVERLFGVRDVDTDDVELLPEQTPYVVRMVRQNGVLTLEGSAPSVPERARMMAAFTTAVPNLAYNDRLRLARGAPERGFAEVLQTLYPILGELKSGVITLSDTTVTIEGEAASNEAYGRLQVPPALPAGYTLASTTVVRPIAAPFSFTAEIDPNGVAVSGYAPDPDARNRLFGLARTAAGLNPVSDRVDLASGAPDGFVETAAAAIDFLDQLATGRIDISGDRVIVSGVAADPASWRMLNAHLAAWKPAGFQVEANVGLPVVAPYTLAAVRSGDKLTVTGFVPTDAVLAGLRSEATRVAGPNNAVVEATLADGAPDGYPGAASFTIQALDHVSAGTASLADRQITISGSAATSADLLELEALVASATPEGYTVTSTVTPPVVSPFVWSLEKTEDSLVVAGFVPSEAARTAIREVAESVSGDLAVADRTQLAAGLPAGVDLEAVAAFAADQIARLDGGSVRLEGETLSLTGASTSARTAATVTSAFDQALPPAVKKGRVTVDAPAALRFTVERALDTVVISGTVADAAARDAVSETVRRSFGAVDVKMSLEEFPGLPAGATDAVVAAVHAASLLATGKVEVDGSVVTVQGKAFTGVGATRLSTDVATDLPSGYRLDASISVAKREPPVPATACQPLVDAVLATNAIRFDTGSGAIAEESHGLVDRVAAVLQRCQGVTVRVEAMSDAPGPVDMLAKERAAAVAQFFNATGIPLESIESAGVEALAPAPGPAASDRRIAITVRPTTP